ncbi:response regulator [Sinimarinibacterium sp. CAU 1509]|uniref:response regulator n=1 Tax=Sinimarinibacterium sp. CAU 1509 TaxID=2562283 RepID=UPI0010ABEF37|nr:response regulator [Sinimarinibacterium sp. CAU 1509]TJY64914.1 response regulator [Sinimarinibacterium sp. CAU 1509]
MNETAEPTARARVLFVDDEPRVLTTMRMLFRNRYELHFSESGAKALDFLRSTPVDVIVSDQRMPGMTGIELLRAARELNPDAMRILLTGYSDLNAIIGSINEGEIFRFVNKPWSNEDLTQTVARAVTAARASADATRAGDTTPTSLGAEPGILVVDDDPRVPAQIQSILGDAIRVLSATSMDDAVSTLERERIGVVVSDTRVQDQAVIGLISTLKQHHPELVSVILTERADAGTAIDLINQGQIYRFITKPLHESQCKITVSSALRQHQRLSQAPQLLQRYEVVAAPEPAPASTTGRLMDRIRSLRSVVKRLM